MTEITSRLADTAAEVEETLATLLPTPTSNGERLAEARLIDAMHYACQGGKRLRAFLTLETATAFGVARDRAMRAACAPVPISVSASGALASGKARIEASLAARL